MGSSKAARRREHIVALHGAALSSLFFFIFSGQMRELLVVLCMRLQGCVRREAHHLSSGEYIGAALLLSAKSRHASWDACRVPIQESMPALHCLGLFPTSCHIPGAGP